MVGDKSEQRTVAGRYIWKKWESAGVMLDKVFWFCNKQFSLPGYTYATRNAECWDQRGDLAPQPNDTIWEEGR